ncbi:unnamed protein product [Moneuplotes crassus]|uniref:Uncharacterized protein n=1 Tax=Euplotes crassus TaxID=5936 RepID=A0AAD2DAH1_EUPCR|nr:unnamed protein product [Moneuplotes crassus]
MKFVHYRCMQNWLNTKRKVQRSLFHVSYYWRLSSCEICKHQFETEFVYNDKILQLLSFETPKKQNDYLILEVLNFDKIKSIHVINVDHRDTIFNNSAVEFTVGRGNSSDIYIPDKSLQKNSCKIELSGGEFRLKGLTQASQTFALELNSVSLADKASDFIEMMIKNKKFKFAIAKSGCISCSFCSFPKTKRVGKPLELLRDQIPLRLASQLIFNNTYNPMQSKENSVEPLYSMKEDSCQDIPSLRFKEPVTPAKGSTMLGTK